MTFLSPMIIGLGELRSCPRKKKAWNASKELREAAMLTKAKLAAQKFAESVRHF